MSALRLRSMIELQLHCLGGFRCLLDTEARKTVYPTLPGRIDMCRGSNVKDTLVRAFQLESLILAQNERWRQA